MRFIDPSVSSAKKTLDINTLPAEVRKDCRNMAKIAFLPDGSTKQVTDSSDGKKKTGAATKNTTLDNMFTRQIEK